jgi:hypothetical protein
MRPTLPPVNALWFVPSPPTDAEIASRCKRSRQVKEILKLEKENAKIDAKLTKLEADGRKLVVK